MLENCLPETLNHKEISHNSTVSVSIVARIVDRIKHTGEVMRSVKPAECLLYEHDVFVLMQIVLERPTIYLHELQRALTQTTEKVCLGGYNL